MPRDKSNAAFVYDMLEAASVVSRFISGRSQRDFQTDEMLRSAVERKIEIIGEAARGLSEEFRKANPSVPWKQIMATRNILAHNYDAVNYLTLWRIATTNVPDL